MAETTIVNSIRDQVYRGLRNLMQMKSGYQKKLKNDYKVQQRSVDDRDFYDEEFSGSLSESLVFLPFQHYKYHNNYNLKSVYEVQQTPVDDRDFYDEEFSGSLSQSLVFLPFQHYKYHNNYNLKSVYEVQQTPVDNRDLYDEEL